MCGPRSRAIPGPAAVEGPQPPASCRREEEDPSSSTHQGPTSAPSHGASSPRAARPLPQHPRGRAAPCPGSWALMPTGDGGQRRGRGRGAEPGSRSPGRPARVARSQHRSPGSLAGSPAAALSPAKLLRQLPRPLGSCEACNCSLSHNSFFLFCESSTVRELKSFQKPIKIS